MAKELYGSHRRASGEPTRHGPTGSLLAALVVFLLCCPVSIAKGVLPLPQADRQANVATTLFMDGCLANLESEAKVKAWIRSNALRPTEPDFSRKVLQGQVGEVWAAPNRGGDFIVIVASPFRCAVWARRADARLALDNFRKIVAAVGRPGIEVVLTRDQSFDGQGGTYRQLAYLLRRRDSSTGWAALATTSESADAEVQVRFTVAAAKP